jgi:hypothetical protein
VDPTDRAVDPAKLSRAFLQLAGQAEPPLRGPAGAAGTFETKAKELLARADAYRELSSSLAHEEAE